MFIAYRRGQKWKTMGYELVLWAGVIVRQIKLFQNVLGVSDN